MKSHEDIKIQFKTLILFKSDKMTTECENFRELLNRDLRKTILKVEITQGSFKAKLGQLGSNIFH